MNVSLQLSWYSIEVHILSFAIMVNASRVRCLATNAPSKSYFSDIFRLILLQIERNLSYERDNPREKKRWITVFRGKRCIQFQTTISWYRCFSLLNVFAQQGDWWWVTVIFLYWYITNCVMVLDDWVKHFICRSHPSISKEHNIWSCIGIEAFWQSGRKELSKVLLTLDMACLIGDISPTGDVTKVARFCNSLLMISSTSSEKQSETDLPIVRISTLLLQ